MKQHKLRQLAGGRVGEEGTTRGDASRADDKGEQSASASVVF
jgi:hypothetical protein